MSRLLSRQRMSRFPTLFVASTRVPLVRIFLSRTKRLASVKCEPQSREMTPLRRVYDSERHGTLARTACVRYNEHSIIDSFTQHFALTAATQNCLVKSVLKYPAQPSILLSCRSQGLLLRRSPFDSACVTQFGSSGKYR